MDCTLVVILIILHPIVKMSGQEDFNKLLSEASSMLGKEMDITNDPFAQLQYSNGKSTWCWYAKHYEFELHEIDFEWVEKCDDKRKIRHACKLLEPEALTYPDLYKCAMVKWEELDPKSHFKHKQEIPVKDEKRDQALLDLDNWLDEMKQKHSPSSSSTNKGVKLISNMTTPIPTTPPIDIYISPLVTQYKVFRKLHSPRHPSHASLVPSGFTEREWNSMAGKSAAELHALGNRYKDLGNEHYSAHEVDAEYLYNRVRVQRYCTCFD